MSSTPCCIDHVGYVVADVDATAKMLSDYAGVDDWVMQSYAPPRLYDQTLHGVDVDHAYRTALGTLNGFKIELLMPLEGESVFSEFLKERPGGLHHICLAYPDEATLDTAKEDLLGKGARITQSGKIQKPQGRGIYYYVEKEGFAFELTVRKS